MTLLYVNQLIQPHLNENNSQNDYRSNLKFYIIKINILLKLFILCIHLNLYIMTEHISPVQQVRKIQSSLIRFYERKLCKLYVKANRVRGRDIGKIYSDLIESNRSRIKLKFIFEKFSILMFCFIFLSSSFGCVRAFFVCLTDKLLADIHLEIRL